MVRVNVDGELSQLPEQSAADLPAAQPIDKGGAGVDGQVDCDSGAVDQPKHFCYRSKRENTPLQPFAKGRQDVLSVQRGVPLQRAVKRKVMLDRRRGGGVFKLRKRLPCRVDVLADHAGGPLPGQTEYRDGAFLGRALSLAVAAPGGLQDGIQPGFLAPGSGEIHIYAGFDQRGRDHPAGQARFEPGADLFQQPLAVGRAEQRRQAIAPLGRQGGKQLLDGGAAVDHAQGLRGIAELRCYFFCRQFTRLPQLCAVEKPVQLVGVRADFPHFQPWRQRVKQRLQSWLGGRAQNGGDAVGLHQLADGRHTGAQIGHGQGLRFVKDDDAARNVVQLAAAGRAVGKQGFKELYGGRDDHGGVPIFGCQCFAVKARVKFAFRHRKICAGMVLYDVFFTQYPAEHLGGLVDDRGVGDHVDDARFPLRCRVRQRKRQRGNRFAAAGGHRQRKQAGGGAFAGI